MPLYTVEIVRMLADRRELRAVEGIYQVRGRLGLLDVPNTLRALIASRLDGLDADERHLLSDAAVLGQSFRLAALARVAERPVDAIAVPVGRLVRRELLDRDTPDPAQASDRFRFSDELVRDVAYSTLALRDRRSRHLAASRYFAATNEPDSAAAVASHLAAAYRSGPITIEHGGLASETVRALRVAAAESAARHSPEGALDSTVQALAMSGDDEERAQLREDAAGFAQAAARLEDAERYATLALDWQQRRGDRIGAARATVRLATILVLRYRSEESIALVRAALDASDGDAGITDEPTMVALLAGLARASLTAGRIDDAAELADRALRLAHRGDLEPVVADALATRGAALLEAGSTVEGNALLRASLAKAEANDSLVPALRARNSLAVGLLDDDPQAAFEVSDTGLRLAQRFGLRDLAVRLASNWAEAGLDLGRWDTVLDMLGQLGRPDLPFVDRVDFGAIVNVIGVWRGQAGAEARLARLDQLIPAEGDRFVEGTLRSRRSAAALALGRPRIALEHADQAAAALRGLGHRTAVHGGDVPGARAALWAGDLQRLDAGLASIEASGLRGRWVEATMSTLRAGRWALIGDMASAAGGYEEAARAWRQLGVPLQLALCQLEAARLLPPAATVARAARVEAQSVLEGLGARRLLDRLDSGLLSVSGRRGPLSS